MLKYQTEPLTDILRSHISTCFFVQPWNSKNLENVLISQSVTFLPEIELSHGEFAVAKFQRAAPDVCTHVEPNPQQTAKCFPACFPSVITPLQGTKDIYPSVCSVVCCRGVCLVLHVRTLKCVCNLLAVTAFSGNIDLRKCETSLLQGVSEVTLVWWGGVDYRDLHKSRRLQKHGGVMFLYAQIVIGFMLTKSPESATIREVSCHVWFSNQIVSVFFILKLKCEKVFDTGFIGKWYNLKEFRVKRFRTPFKNWRI